jgi:hypothetical protein
MNVVRQSLERRDIDHLGRVSERSFEALPDQIVDRRKERGERLARTGRRRDQRMAARFDCGPGFGLSSSRRGECLSEPCRDRRMEQRFEARRRSRRSGTRLGRARSYRPADGPTVQGQRHGGVSQNSLLSVVWRGRHFSRSYIKRRPFTSVSDQPAGQATPAVEAARSPYGVAPRLDKASLLAFAFCKSAARRASSWEARTAPLDC